MERKLLIDDYNKDLEKYYERQDDAKIRKEQEIFDTIITDANATRIKVNEYVLQLDYYKKQLYLMPDSYKTILQNVMFHHTMLISRLYKFRTMLEQIEYREVLTNSKNIDVEAIIYLIRRFGANLDILKNVQAIIRKEDGTYYSQSFYYDLKKLRKVASDLHQVLEIN